MNFNIYQTTQLLSKQQVIALGLFNDGKSKQDSKYMRFFKLIHEKKIRNDEESIRALQYRNRASFLKFKDRYKKKLLNYLVLSEFRTKPVDTSNELYFDLLKLYSAAKILHFRHQKNNALVLYKYINNLSLENQYFDLLLFTTTELKKHYAYVDPNEKLYKLYTERIKKCEHDIDRINDINHYYDEISHNNIMLHGEKLSSFKESSLLTAHNLLENINEDDSFDYKSKIYEIAAFAFNLNQKYKESIEVSKKSIELTNNHFDKIHSKTVLAYRDILTAYLRLQDFENAYTYLTKILSNIKSIAHNYFRYKSLEYTLYAVTSDYNKLYTLTNEIISLKKLKDYRIHFEEWTIREAFVNILIEAGKIDPTLLENSKRKFKLNRFINEVEFYSKDKRGTNISVQVIQLIHFLIRRDYDKIVDRLDALNQYTFRYLRNDETLRSNCFIKMLLKIPEAEYHPLRTERYVAKYTKKLAENPFEVSMKEIAIEIIPYEHLWEIIMEILNKNLEKKTSRR